MNEMEAGATSRNREALILDLREKVKALELLNDEYRRVIDQIKNIVSGATSHTRSNRVWDVIQGLTEKRKYDFHPTHVCPRCFGP